MRAYVQVSGIVFGLVALGHLLRLLRRWPLLIAGHPVPALVSALVVVGAGALAIWAWRSLAAAPAAG